MPTPEAKGFKDRLTGTVYAVNDETAREEAAKAVQFAAQSLTDEQQAQARENIGAVSEAEMDSAIESAITGSIDDTLSETGKAADAKETGGRFAEQEQKRAQDPFGNLATYGATNYGKALTNSNGNLSDNTSYDTTDYIAVTPGETLYAKGCSRSWFYASDKSDLTGSGRTINIATLTDTLPDGSKVFTVPAGAAYFRTCYMKTNYGAVYVRRPTPYDLKLKLGADAGYAARKTVLLTDWYNGAIAPGDGKNGSDATTRLRSEARLGCDWGTLSVTAASGYEFAIFGYETKTGTYKGYLNTLGEFSKTTANLFINGVYTYFCDFNKYPNLYFRIMVRAADNSDITTAEGENIVISQGIWQKGAQKKWYCLGDSITRGIYTDIGDTAGKGPSPYGYPYWVALENGYEVVNLGRSGGGYLLQSTAEHESAVDTVDENDFSDADIISIALGLNDYKASPAETLGDVDTSTAGDGTVIGAMMSVLETLAGDKAPKAQIIILLPLNEKRFSGAAGATEETDWAFGYQFNDGTLQEYRAAIRKCAEHYHVKVVDPMELSPLNRLNMDAFLGDGAHPTLEFHRLLGQALAPHIR